jgi:hypothetical protein
MNTVVGLLITLLLLTPVLVLWGLLVMASWSDRQMASAWRKWLDAKPEAETTAD